MSVQKTLDQFFQGVTRARTYRGTQRDVRVSLGFGRLKCAVLLDPASALVAEFDVSGTAAQTIWTDWKWPLMRAPRLATLQVTPTGRLFEGGMPAGGLPAEVPTAQLGGPGAELTAAPLGGPMDTLLLEHFTDLVLELCGGSVHAQFRTVADRRTLAVMDHVELPPGLLALWCIL